MISLLALTIKNHRQCGKFGRFGKYVEGGKYSRILTPDSRLPTPCSLLPTEFRTAIE
ncbi:hypothetical protein [Moorena sp. SIO3H5]|uniref:hypothetical protein n=1 Tax=Moorena sp. SIO3H5 TaxID=2607834 RepID=UPI0013B9A950|nr:hypothetical protein [Moorena sp. SIO3H5]NEO71745.1 hypothetical protein [Moorena sp. SIO3H5]